MWFAFVVNCAGRTSKESVIQFYLIWTPLGTNQQIPVCVRGTCKVFECSYLTTFTSVNLHLSTPSSYFWLQKAQCDDAKKIFIFSKM